MMDCILGYGIAGAICKHFLPSFKVVSDNFIGSNMQAASGWHLGPRHIFYSERAARLLEGLKLDTSTREIKIAYMHDTQILSSLTEEFIEEYNLKTRGVKKNVSGSLASQMKDFKIFNTSQVELFDKLASRLKSSDTITGKVTDIDVQKKLLFFNGNKMSMNFNKAVCTLPLPLIVKMSSVKSKVHHDFAAKDIYFTRLSKTLLIEYFGATSLPYENDIIYISCKEIPFYRISRVWSREFADYYFVGESMKAFDDHSLRLPFAKIVNPKRFDFLSDDFLLVGRYSQWDNEVRTREVIEYAETLAKTI